MQYSANPGCTYCNIFLIYLTTKTYALFKVRSKVWCKNNEITSPCTFPSIFPIATPSVKNMYVLYVLLTKCPLVTELKCEMTQECVAVSINICPWQDPMQFGIKILGTPYDTPGCRWDVSYVQQSRTTRSITALHFV